MNLVPFGLYILYMQHVAATKEWDIATDESYQPTVTIIIPTFEEGNTVRGKLDNLALSDYPKGKMQLIVVDSASTDETVDLVKSWMRDNPEINTRLICQDARRGMVNALNEGLVHATGEIIVKTDSDCFWKPDSLSKAMKYLADPRIGSVAGLHLIEANKETSAVKTERQYREYYRSLRIGESKLYSTVLYEGELMLVRGPLLQKLKFDEEIGADDVPTALRVAENGYRAISAPDAYFIEKTPYSWGERFNQKTRRARHVVQSLWKYKYLMFKGNTPLHRFILPFEFYIYAVNPFFTIALIPLTILMFVMHPLLLLLTPLLLVPRIRETVLTQIANSCVMVYAILAETLRKESVTWKKIDEIR